MGQLTGKERKQLADLNALVNSIDRVTDKGLQWLQQSTTDDLKAFKEMLDRKRKELLAKIN